MRIDWLGAIRIGFKPWLLAWGCSIFFSSALLAVLYPVNQVGFLSRFWAIADEMSPLAKLMFGGGLALTFILLASARRISRFSYLQFGPAAATIPAIVMAIIPVDYSRGFGLGFSAELFDPVELGCWMIGSFLGGLLFVYHRLSA